MAQPQGFVDHDCPHRVCKLKKKTRYGLKQAPRAWYNELKQFLLTFGFYHALSDTFFFIYSHQGFIIYLFMYVDDIVYTGYNFQFLSAFIYQLSS